MQTDNNPPQIGRYQTPDDPRRQNQMRQRDRDNLNERQMVENQNYSLSSQDNRERKQKERHFGFKMFEEWSTYDPEKLLHTIQADNAFKDLLTKGEIKEEWMSVVIKVLAIAFESTISRRILLMFMQSFTKSLFVRLQLPKFISSLYLGFNSRNSIGDSRMCIKNALSIFRIMLMTIPSACTDLLPVITTIDFTANKNDGLLLCDESKCLLMDVIELTTEIQTKMQEQKQATGTQNIHAECGPPPEDFRTISIFPTSKDIYPDNDIFLRVNKLKGGYENVEHYLDVQFRLMREDFVAPLREGIKQYLEQLRMRNIGRLNDIRVYHDVRILYPVCANVKGITYRVRFDVEHLKNVRWDVSRRLIFGSLVCLSSDTFETMFFATVSDRDTKTISKGEIELQFEHNQDEVSEITPDQSFVMAETTAYFEAYRHVLLGLQQMRDENFQFQRYIVHTADDVGHPLYLTRNRQEDGIFDLRPLVDYSSALPSLNPLRRHRRALDLNDSDEEDEDRIRAEIEIEEVRYSEKAEREAKAVKIVNSPSWPDAATLHLDISQYRAVKAALTREFAIIQGPPGTGKTYIGLKVVKALLHNYKAWCRDPVTTVLDPRPILLVCYTNHALDQFLEGVMKFMKKGIVRVGGRSQNEALSPYLLRNLRNDMRHLKEVPAEIYRGRMVARQRLEETQADIESIGAQLEAAERGVMHENTLRDVIPENLMNSLQNGYYIVLQQKEKDEWSTVGITQQKSAIGEWLNLEMMLQEELSKVEQKIMQMQGIRPQDKPNMQGQEAMPPGLLAVPHGLLNADIGENMEQLNLADGDDMNEDDDDGVDIEDELQREDDRRMLDIEEDSKGKKPKTKSKPDFNKFLALNIENLDAETEQPLPNASQLEAENTFMPVKLSKRKLKRRLKKLLLSTNIMSEEEEAAIYDVWGIPVAQRWRLYRLWVNLYRRQLKSMTRDLEREYQNFANIVQEVLQREDIEIMRKAKVVGMTTTAAAKYRLALGDLKPKIIVVEEAAEVLESHVVTTIANSCEHLILIGDHQQLRPSPNVHKLAKKYNLEISLFERMVRNNLPCETLHEQHRMRPQISNLMLNIYPGLKDHKSVLNYEDIKGMMFVVILK